MPAACVNVRLSPETRTDSTRLQHRELGIYVNPSPQHVCILRYFVNSEYRPRKKAASAGLATAIGVVLRAPGYLRIWRGNAIALLRRVSDSRLHLPQAQSSQGTQR